MAGRHSQFSLADFKAVQSDDEVKRDLELTCLVCGTVVCDVQDEDDMAVLTRTAMSHFTEARAEDNRDLTNEETPEYYQAVYDNQEGR